MVGSVMLGKGLKQLVDGAEGGMILPLRVDNLRKTLGHAAAGVQSFCETEG